MKCRQNNSNELENWRSQFGTSSDKMGLRYPPMAFSEQGVAMLSSVLSSKKAILVNIAIIKTFVRMREMIKNNEIINSRLADIEERMDTQEMNTIVIMDKLRTLNNSPKKKSRKIGFNAKK